MVNIFVMKHMLWQSRNGFENYKASSTPRQDFMNFGPQTTKNRTGDLPPFSTTYSNLVVHIWYFCDETCYSQSENSTENYERSPTLPQNFAKSGPQTLKNRTRVVPILRFFDDFET